MPQRHPKWHTCREENRADILELNLDQELARIDQDTLFLVFLYLQNAYNNVDRGRLLIPLEGYRDRPRMCKLLVVFWGRQEFVTRQNSYHSLYFKLTRGTTQGGIVSPTLFNLIVDNVVRNWLALAVEYQLVSHEGLGLLVGRCLGLFYADDIMVVLRGPEWL